MRPSTLFHHFFRVSHEVARHPWLLLPEPNRPLATAVHRFPVQKLLYVEVPKAACTSVKTFLSPLFKKGGWHSANEMGIHEWMGYSFIKSEDFAREIRTTYKDWTVFTVVRHPIHRFRSLFFDKLLTDPALTPDLGLAGFPSTEPQLDVFLDAFEHSRWYRYDHHGRLQTSLIGTDLSLFDFVGRSEDMDEVFAFLKNFTHAEAVSLHAHRSKGNQSWDFPPTIKKRLYDLYEQDFTTLKYAI